MDGIDGLEYLECGPAVATEGCPTQSIVLNEQPHQRKDGEDALVDVNEEQTEAAAALNREIEEEIRRLDCTDADLDGEITAQDSPKAPEATGNATAEVCALEDPPQVAGSDLDRGVEQGVCGSESPGAQFSDGEGQVLGDVGSGDWVDPKVENLGCSTEDEGSESGARISETWEILRVIEGMIRKAIDLPQDIPLSDCKPDSLDRIPRDLLGALEEALAVLSYQQTVLEKQAQHSPTDTDDGMPIRTPSRLHRGVKDLEMWAIKNKYLTHVAPNFIPGVLPPEDLSPSSRQCGYPVPRMYLYQRLEQQAKLSQQQKRRSAAKTQKRRPSENPKQLSSASETRRSKPAAFSTVVPTFGNMAAPGKSHSKESVGREKDCGEKGGGQEAEKRCTVESRLSLRQRQQVSRSLHLQSDQEFIGRSKERSKQSLDKHKQVSEKSQEAIDNLRHQTRHMKVQREWARFQAMMLEKTRIQRALKSTNDNPTLH